MSEWISIKITSEPEDRQFIAAWFIDGDLEGIEWYVKMDDRMYMNLNSNNANDFTDEDMFTHWMPLPEPPK